MLIVLMNMLPYSCDFDDYLYVINSLGEEERKKWRTKFTSRISNASRDNLAALELSFQIMLHDKAYKKMLDKLRNGVDYPMILKYVEPLINTNAIQLFEELMGLDDYEILRKSTTTREQVKLAVAELADIILNRLSKEGIKLAVSYFEKNWRFRSPNLFHIYIKDKIMER